MNIVETAVCWHGKNKTLAASNLVSPLPGTELNGRGEILGPIGTNIYPKYREGVGIY